MSDTAPLLYIGSASAELGATIAATLQLPIEKIEHTRFRNTEMRLRVQSEVAGRSCIVVQSTGQPVHDNLFELFLLVDTLKQSGAAHITAVVPYLGYARQHKRFRAGECVTSVMILRMLKHLGADRVVTVNAHHPESFADAPLPVTNISVLSAFADVCRSDAPPTTTVVVSPDEGGRGRAMEFARHLFQKNDIEIAWIKKRRDVNTAHLLSTDGLVGDVKNKNVIIVDDICTTGGTLLQAATVCRTEGAASVSAVIVHADMDDKTIERIEQSPIQKMYISNTLSASRHASLKIHGVDIGKSIAEELLSS